MGFKKIILAFLLALLVPQLLCRGEEGEISLQIAGGRGVVLHTVTVQDSPYFSLPELTGLLKETGEGFQVEWDDTFGVLRISRGPDNYSLFLDKSTLLVNTQILEVEEPVRVIAGEILVPLSSLKILNRLWKVFTFETEAKAPTQPKTKTPSPTPSKAVPESRPAPPPALPKTRFMRVVLDPATESLKWEDLANQSHVAPSQESVTLEIALTIKRILEREGSVEVILTSHGNESPSMREKIERINTSGGDVLVCLRLNASEFETVGGVDILVTSGVLDPESENLKQPAGGEALPVSRAYLPYQRQSLVLGTEMAAQLEKAVSVRVGPITPAPLYLLKRSAMPSVMVTCGYVTNARDAVLLSKDRTIESLSRAIAGALLKYKDLHLRKK